jgi:hypothetical protein
VLHWADQSVPRSNNAILKSEYDFLPRRVSHYKKKSLSEVSWHDDYHRCHGNFGAVDNLDSWNMCWSAYYSMTQYPRQLRKIEAHVRRRLRSRLVDQQKPKRNLLTKLVKRKVLRPLAVRTSYSNKDRWAPSCTRELHMAHPNRFCFVGAKSRWNVNERDRRASGFLKDVVSDDREHIFETLTVSRPDIPSDKFLEYSQMSRNFNHESE